VTRLRKFVAGVGRARRGTADAPPPSTPAPPPAFDTSQPGSQRVGAKRRLARPGNAARITGLQGPISRPKLNGATPHASRQVGFREPPRIRVKRIEYQKARLGQNLIKARATECTLAMLWKLQTPGPPSRHPKMELRPRSLSEESHWCRRGKTRHVHPATNPTTCQRM
jgi:hypothetical protein